MIDTCCCRIPAVLLNVGMDYPQESNPHTLPQELVAALWTQELLQVAKDVEKKSWIVMQSSAMLNCRYVHSRISC